MFYEIGPEAMKKLNTPWVAAYSGGKDSTSLVTWLEWLRRTEQIIQPNPGLVISNTGVEYPFLEDCIHRMSDCLRKSGWTCDEVHPLTKEKLYCQIFGRGVTPIHPGIRRFRWCSGATKRDPMNRHRKLHSTDLLTLTGMRWGESGIRDEKLKGRGCQAGGECGTQLEGRSVYAPIINWKDCNIYDWLEGVVDMEINKVIKDLLQITGDLVGVYSLRKGQTGFDGTAFKVLSLRFGCIGCPAIEKDKVLCHAVKTETKLNHLKNIYRIWKLMRRDYNRLVVMRNGKRIVGPLKMEARKKFFADLMEIQEKSGVVLVTKEDDSYIRQCWADQVYPRGWSAEDEKG